MISRRHLAFGLVSALGGAAMLSPAAAQRVWQSYKNERFGTTRDAHGRLVSINSADPGLLIRKK